MTRCTITCMEPGCKAHIRYETDPEEGRKLALLSKHKGWKDVFADT